jgi:hypothetical protein
VNIGTYIQILIIGILEKNLDKIDWSALSKNTAAISILEKNLDKIDWSVLSPKTYKENIRDITEQINASFAKK